MNNGIVYFELNNWACGKDYPDDEPFISWLSNDFSIYFNNEEWVKENKLCVVKTMIDMSINFCISATKDWVESNCPKLLTDYRDILRFPDEDDEVYGRFGTHFNEYLDENIGIEYVDEDDY